GPAPHRRREPPPRRHRSPSYSKGVIAVLGAVWEAAAYPCAVRLKALLPLWMPWVRKRFRLTAATESGVLRISARQMDRRLEERKKRVGHRPYGGTKPGRLLQHLIPLRADQRQADGLGSLRHPAGRGSHECFVSERAPSVAQSLSAFGEADQESARGLEAAAPLRSSLHASGSAGSWGSRRGYGPHPSRRPPESSAGPGPVRTQPPNRSQAASDLRSRAHAPEPQGPAQGARGKGYILKWLDTNPIRRATVGSATESLMSRQLAHDLEGGI